mgnify:CR=1 FL=1
MPSAARRPPQGAVGTCRGGTAPGCCRGAAVSSSCLQRGAGATPPEFGLEGDQLVRQETPLVYHSKHEWPNVAGLAFIMPDARLKPRRWLRPKWCVVYSCMHAWDRCRFHTASLPYTASFPQLAPSDPSGCVSRAPYRPFCSQHKLRSWLRVQAIHLHTGSLPPPQPSPGPPNRPPSGAAGTCPVCKCPGSKARAAVTSFSVPGLAPHIPPAEAARPRLPARDASPWLSDCAKLVAELSSGAQYAIKSGFWAIETK